MAGARLEQAYPVVPLAEDHSLSIGMFSYRDSLFFGLYADPEALPEVRRLPGRARRRRDELRGDRPHGRPPPLRAAPARRVRRLSPARRCVTR